MEIESNLIYKPENYNGPEAIDCSVKVKFSQASFVHKNLLDTWGIILPEDQYDESCTGKGLFYKNSEGKVTDKWKKCFQRDEDGN